MMKRSPFAVAERRPTPWLWVCLALAAALRLAMGLVRKSFWGDEWFTIALISKSLPEVIRGAVADVHPPLSFVLARAFVAALGPSEWAFRLPSLLAGLGAVVMIYLLARRVAGPRAGALAGLWAAVSPYFLQSSHEIRGYALLGFVSAGAFYFTLRAIEEAPILDRPARGFQKTLAFQTIFLSLVVWSEHYGWFVWAAAAVSAVLESRRSSRRVLLLPPAIALILGCPSLAVAVRQALFSEQILDVSRMKEYLSPAILVKKTAGIFWHWTCGYRFSMLTVDGVAGLLRRSAELWVSLAATLAALVLFAGGMFPGREQARLKRLMGLGVWFPLIFLALVYPIRLDARYLAFAAPVFLTAVCAGAIRIKHFWIRTGCLALFFAVSIFGSAHAILLRTDSIHREDYRTLARTVFEESGEGDAIAGLSPQVEYYAREFGDRSRARRFGHLEEFLSSHPQRFKKLRLLGVTNMHPDVAARIRRENEEPLAAAGFRPVGQTRRFPPEADADGGGLATLDLYENTR